MVVLCASQLLQVPGHPPPTIVALVVFLPTVEDNKKPAVCGPSMTHARSRVRIDSVLCGSSDGCYAQSDLVVFPECLDLAVFSKMYQ